MGWGVLPAVPDPPPERRVGRVSIPREVWAPAAADAVRSLMGRSGVCPHGAVADRCQPCRVEAELRAENDRLRTALSDVIDVADDRALPDSTARAGVYALAQAAMGTVLASGELPVVDVDEA